MKHVLFTLKGCNPELLNDELYIRAVLTTAAGISKSTLLKIESHQFEPQGVTAFALLAESHISIHTWPENGTAVCDAFTCGDHTNPDFASIYMGDALESSSVSSELIMRSF